MANVNDDGTLSIKSPVLLVGIGGAGTKIAMSAGAALGCRCLLISNDRKDLIQNDSCTSVFVDSGQWVNPSSLKLRSFIQSYQKQISSLIEGFPTVIVASNLAGRAGTAIAPLLCRMAKGLSSTVISVAVMPFKFEKDRIFSSGVALRRVREASDSTIVMDNDAFIDNNPELSAEDCYRLTNGAIVEVVSSIMSSSGLRPDMNILCTSKDNGASAESSLRDSVSMLYGDVSDPESIKRTAVYVMGGDKLPVGTLNTLSGYMQGVFKEEGASDVAMLSSSSSGVRVHLVASAPQNTRFDRYDPLGDILPKENMLDWDEPDSLPDIRLAIPSIEL